MLGDLCCIVSTSQWKYQRKQMKIDIVVTKHVLCGLCTLKEALFINIIFVKLYEGTRAYYEFMHRGCDCGVVYSLKIMNE